MMNKLIIVLCFLSIMLNSCSAQNKEDKQMEKYDFELMKKFKATGALDTIINKNDTLIFVNGMMENGTSNNEYPPAPNMYFTQKKFYPNGNMESKKTYIGKYLTIGESVYYNKEGKITKVDEDAKFGKIKPDQILQFIEKEGWIDLKTGKGREEIIFTETNRGYIQNGVFTLAFFKAGEHPEIKNNYPLWYITIEDSPKTKFYQTIYKIHGETGEVLEKTSEQIFRLE